MAICANESENGLLLCGDLNSRIGNLINLNGHSYSKNPDTFVNQHGKQLLEIIDSHNLLPLNRLENNGNQFEGGITFERGE